MRVMLYMLLLSILVPITTKQESTYKELFNFREKVLEQFNVVRRFFAAGDFAKLYELASLIFKFFGGNLRENILGPAANMHQLKWSRRLEEISFEYMEKELDSKSVPNILKSIEYKNHIGFIWMGNILDLIKDFVNVIPIPGKAIEQIKETLAEVFKYLELFITIIWIAAAAPKGLYLERGVHYGPVEALFAERYEIGCWSDPFFSNSIQFLFQFGPACTNCSTHCEFWEEIDKTIVEGDLCVPPNPHHEKMLEKEPEGLTAAVNRPNFLFCILVSFVLWMVLR